MLKATLVLLFVCLTTLNAEARAGGGGRGGGGSGKGNAAGIAIAAVVYAIIELRRRHMMKKAKADREESAKFDPTWDEKLLRAATEKAFYAYQKAWTTKNLDSVRDLLHVDYYKNSSRILLEEMKDQTNVIRDPSLESMNLMAIRDVPGKDGDMFVMEVNASMIDYTVETLTDKFVESTLDRKDSEWQSSYEERARTEAGTFREYWVFQRVSGVWKLWDVQDSSRIIADLKGRSESELKEILAREQASGVSDDEMFFKRAK